MDAYECGDEVILKGSYGALGEVGAMVTGRLELGVNLMSIEEIEERLRDFIISCNF